MWFEVFFFGKYDKFDIILVHSMAYEMDEC